jgi:hypothetical protein
MSMSESGRVATGLGYYNGTHCQPLFGGKSYNLLGRALVYTARVRRYRLRRLKRFRKRKYHLDDTQKRPLSCGFFELFFSYSSF